MGMDWGAVAGGFSDGLHRNRESTMRERQVRLQEARDARDSELHGFRVSEAADKEDERVRLKRANVAAARFAANYGRQPQEVQPPQVGDPGLPRIAPATDSAGKPIDRGDGVQTMPYQDDGPRIPSRALPDTEGADPGFARGQDAPTGGLARARAPAPSAPDSAAQPDRDPDRVIGSVLFSNPGRLGDANFLNGMMQIYAKEGLADKAKPYWEALYKAEEQKALSTAIALVHNDPDTAFRLNQAAGGRKYARPPELIQEGPDKGKWRATFQDGRSEVFDARAAFVSGILEPGKQIESTLKFAEGDRKEAESGAKIAEHKARTSLIDAQRDFTAGARTNQANAQGSRLQRPPESKESVDRAHQFVDAQLQRLATATEGGRPVIDEVTKKPVVDQARLNSLYTLHNEVQLRVEDLLGRELTSREIRVLGQRMASAPLGDAAAGKKWVLETVRSMASRPSAGATPQQPVATQLSPPVPGARLAAHPQTGEKGWVIQGEDGRPLWRPMGPQQTTSSAASAPPPSGAPATVAPPPTAAPAAPVTSSAAAASPQPGTPQATPTEQAGAQLDAARANLKTSSDALRRYGARMRRDDPEGYAKAQQTYSAAVKAEADAARIYEGMVGKQAPVTGRTGYADGGLVRRSGMTATVRGAPLSQTPGDLTRRGG